MSLAEPNVEAAVNRFRHPEGRQLPALERNILKYRAFEMVLTLFYSEGLKRQIVSAVRSRDRLAQSGNVKIQRATEVLVAEGILTKEEREEIGKLIEVRNQIAHNVQNLTSDISRSAYVRSHSEFSGQEYDYGSLKRLKYFHQELLERISTRYVTEISMDGILFESAEKAYEAELKTLNRKIRAQISAREKKNILLNRELSLSDTEFQSEEMYPAHPANRIRNGTLSDRGVEVCFRLFDIGKRPIVVAYLMYISLAAARHRHNQWVKEGGLDRKKVEIAPLSSSRIRARKSTRQR